MRKLLLLAMMSLAAVLSASAERYEYKGVIYGYNSYEPGVCYVEGYATGYETQDLVVSLEGSELSNRSISYIDENAFKGWKGKQVTLAPVEFIYEYAFAGCDQLETVNFSEGDIYIQAYAFQGCKALKSVALPKGVRALYGCFDLCDALTDVSIEDVATLKCMYGSSTGFCGAPSPINLTIRSAAGATEYGPYTFYRDCSYVRSLTLPEGVTSIEDGALKVFSGMEDLHLPSSLTRIGYFAFNGCEALKNVNIPAGVQELERLAFDGCKSLEHLYIYGDRVLGSTDDVFDLSEEEANAVTIHVPAHLVDAYKAGDNWKMFANIVPLTVADGITAVHASTGETAIYDLTGKKLSGMQKGVNVIKMKDGSVRKVTVK